MWIHFKCISSQDFPIATKDTHPLGTYVLGCGSLVCSEHLIVAK